MRKVPDPIDTAVSMVGQPENRLGKLICKIYSKICKIRNLGHGMHEIQVDPEIYCDFALGIPHVLRSQRVMDCLVIILSITCKAGGGTVGRWSPCPRLVLSAGPRSYIRGRVYS